jgi:hypothetical protein
MACFSIAVTIQIFSAAFVKQNGPAKRQPSILWYGMSEFILSGAYSNNPGRGIIHEGRTGEEIFCSIMELMS